MKTTSTTSAVAQQHRLRARVQTYPMIATSVVALGIVALLASSNALAQASEPAKPIKAVKPDARTAQAHMHTSAHAKMGQKAKGSGVLADAEGSGKMDVGQPSRMTLVFHGAHMDGATATVQPPRGVTVTRLDGTPVGEVALKVGRQTRLDVWVTASDDGLQYLDVTTLQDGRASVRSLPLKVGSGAVKLKSNGQVVMTPSGEAIVSMPAVTR